MCHETKYFQHDPIYNITKYCTMRSSFYNLTTTPSYFNYSSTTNYTNTSTANSATSRCVISTYKYKTKTLPEPNIALISFLLIICTCVLALALKKLRRSNFFGSYVSIDFVCLTLTIICDCDSFLFVH